MTVAVKRIKQALRLTLDHPKSLSCDHGRNGCLQNTKGDQNKSVNVGSATFGLFVSKQHSLLEKKVNLIDLI